MRFDEAIALPTEFSARIARNTQLIIQEETHITERDRPLGRQLHDGEADAGHGRRGLGDHRGGRGDGRHDAARCDSGWAKLKIEASAAEKQARIDSGKDVIVGVNKYRLDKEDADRDAARSTTTRCATTQIARLQARARRARRRRGAGGARRADRRARDSGEGNLLDLSDPGGARCAPRSARSATRSRRSAGRHRADTQKVTGVYAAAYD